jgi:hypothetical protein
VKITMSLELGIARKGRVGFEWVPCSTAIVGWDNLWQACRLAARGKRREASAAEFEYQVADRLIVLQSELRTKAYHPGAYCHFFHPRAGAA